ncbi:type II toxin-antitoxin system antitoxin TscA [Staphylococcus borealis]|uniref:type II toxin-antitoxin system antitoxin TscA n=1 Tax=Staphylococcus borealis TaxID=2742203 RepID=UPI00374EFB01
MSKDQLEVIEEIYNTLQATVEDKSTEYKHKVKEGNTEWTETVNREEHLQAIIEWAIQQIENNFDGVK